MIKRYTAIPMTDTGELPMQKVVLATDFDRFVREAMALFDTASVPNAKWWEQVLALENWSQSDGGVDA
jgi:hypothetical protein